MQFLKILMAYTNSLRSMQSGAKTVIHKTHNGALNTGLLIAVAPRYRYCSGTTFRVAVAVAPLLLAESSGDSSAATCLAAF